MFDPILFLAIMVCVTIVVVKSERNFAKQQHEIWSNFAKDMGAQYDALESARARESVTWTIADGKIRLRSWRVHPFWITEISAPYSGSVDFTIRRCDVINNVNAFQEYYRPIYTGISTLDQNFVMSCSDQAAMHRYLRSGAIANVIISSVTDKLTASTERHLISHTEARYINDPARMRTLYDLMRMMMEHHPE